MPIPWPSEEWISLWVDELNASEVFHSAAGGWEGSFGSVIQVRPPHQGNDIHLCFEVSNGTFTRYSYGCDHRGWDLRFIVEADYETWKRFIEQDLDPVKAALLGNVRIRGNAVEALRFVRAAYEMLRATAQIPTSFEG